MKWKVPYIDLPEHFRKLEAPLTDAFRDVMSRGSFILRDDVSDFESSMAEYLGVKHVVGLNSGTDALYLSTAAIGLEEGDEVISVAHSFVATLSAIKHRGASPVLVDIAEDHNIDSSQLEKAVTSKTKAIIPVHLNGRVSKMDVVMDVADKYGLEVIEDAAQAIGASYKGKMAGSFGISGCFSLHPMKTLHCAGDGGFVSTNDPEFAEEIRMLRNHGQRTKTDLVCFGYNSRLDNLQAALLNVKLPHLNDWIEHRRSIAQQYQERLSETPLILPPAPSNGDHFDTFSSYVVKVHPDQRDGLSEHLRSQGVEVFSHIAVPLYNHKALGLPQEPLPNTEAVSTQVLSLPIHPEMTDDQTNYVIETVEDFFN